MTVDLAGLAKWIADHPAPEKPYDAVMEERMAAAANGQSLRALPTDPAVKGGRRPDRWDGEYVSRDGGFSWAYEPGGDAA